jgi:predicted RNase H-like HicB family nuclease
MVLDLILIKTDDGCIAEIPSLKGCESWAHDEETVLIKILELAAFYLNTDIKKLKIDKARGNKNRIIYKLIFNSA